MPVKSTDALTALNRFYWSHELHSSSSSSGRTKSVKQFQVRYVEITWTSAQGQNTPEAYQPCPQSTRTAAKAYAGRGDVYCVPISQQWWLPACVTHKHVPKETAQQRRTYLHARDSLRLKTGHGYYSTDFHTYAQYPHVHVK